MFRTLLCPSSGALATVMLITTLVVSFLVCCKQNTEQEGVAVTLFFTIRQVIVSKVGRHTFEISDIFGALLVLL